MRCTCNRFPIRPPLEPLSELVSQSNADYIVFESVPIDTPPFRRRDATSVLGISSIRPHFDQLAIFWDQLTSGLLSLIEYLGGSDPLAPMLDYLVAVTLVAGACKSVGVRAVVLSPFAGGHSYSTKSVIAYKDALRDLARVQQIILVDCSDALKSLPKSILHHDSRRLAPIAQKAVGQVVADSIVTDALARSRRFEAFDLVGLPRPELLHRAFRQTKEPLDLIAKRLNW